MLCVEFPKMVYKKKRTKTQGLFHLETGAVT